MNQNIWWELLHGGVLHGVVKPSLNVLAISIQDVTLDWVVTNERLGSSRNDWRGSFWDTSITCFGWLLITAKVCFELDWFSRFKFVHNLFNISLQEGMNSKDRIICSTWDRNREGVSIIVVEVDESCERQRSTELESSFNLNLGLCYTDVLSFGES